jgi:RNA polymerase sigma factor (sigma-70 family)
MDIFDERLDAAAEEDRLDELVARFGHRVPFFVSRVERRYGLSDGVHDDLVSAGYWGLLKALRNRRSDAHEHELSAYVSRRVEGAILDEARRALGHLSTHGSLGGLEVDGVHGTGLAPGASGLETEGEEDPEQLADRRARWRAVERELEGLEASQRQLLVALASGHSLAEAARRLGSTPARLQGQLGRAVRHLRARAPELRRILRQEI